MKKLRRIISSAVAVTASCAALLAAGIFINARPASGQSDKKASELFTGLNNAALTDYAKLPDYHGSIVRPDGRTLLLNSAEGVHALKLSVVDPDMETASIKLKNTVDITKNTKLDSLLEFIVLPEEAHERSKKEERDYPHYFLQGVELKLTDAHDSSNWVAFEIVTRPDYNYYSSARAGTSRQTVAGITGNGDIQSADIGGFGARLYYSLIGIDPIVSDTAVFSSSLALDAAANEAYAYPGTSSGGAALIKKLSDVTHMLAGDELWEGFTTGEVSIELSLQGVKEGANIFILGVNGADLTENIADTTPPKLFIKDSVDMQQPPLGLIGESFPVFKAGANDDFDGAFSFDDIIVTVTDPSGGDVEVINGEFIPKVKGLHKLNYSVADGSGNAGSLEVSVTVQNALPELGFELNGSIEENVQVGQKIILPGYNLAKVPVSRPVNLVERRIFLNGSEVELAGNTLTALQGIYEIIYTVKEYSRQTDYVYMIKSLIKKEPAVTSLPSLPAAFIGGHTYRLPQLTAYDTYFNSDGTAAANVDIFVSENGGTERLLGADRQYTFAAQTGSVSVRYEARSLLDATVKTVLAPISRPIIKAENITDYFYVNSSVDIINTGAATNEDGKALFSATADNASFSFVNPLPLEGFSFSARVPEGYGGFTAYKLTLTDSVDLSKQIEITFEKYSSAQSMIIVGSQSAMAIGGFNGSENIQAGIKNGTVYSSGNYVCSLERAFSDYVYEEFSADTVYLTVTFIGVTGQSGMTVSNLCGRSNIYFGAKAETNTYIYRQGVLNTYYSTGDLIVIPAAWSLNVYETCTAVTVSVTFKNKAGESKTVLDNVAADREFIFLAGEEGTYTVSYISGRTRINSTLNVLEGLDPSLSVDGAVYSTARPGETLSVPSVSMIGGDETRKVYVMLKTPTGAMADITETLSFTAEIAGVYTLYYYVADVTFYTALQYKITVK